MHTLVHQAGIFTVTLQATFLYALQCTRHAHFYN